MWSDEKPKKFQDDCRDPNKIEYNFDYIFEITFQHGLILKIILKCYKNGHFVVKWA